MPKTRELSREQLAQIKVLSQQKLSTRKISDALDIPQTTVAYTLRRQREKQSLSPWKRSGRPRVTSATSDRQLRRTAVKNPTWSSAAIAAKVPCKVSTRTIRRRLLTEFHLQSRRPARKSRLSSKNVRDRFAFCKRYDRRSVDDRHIQRRVHVYSVPVLYQIRSTSSRSKI